MRIFPDRFNDLPYPLALLDLRYLPLANRLGHGEGELRKKRWRDWLLIHIIHQSSAREN